MDVHICICIHDICMYVGIYIFFQVVVLPEVSIPHLARVQFQEGTDNNKNFPNVKAFHAFKKQRYRVY